MVAVDFWGSLLNGVKVESVREYECNAVTVRQTCDSRQLHVALRTQFKSLEYRAEMQLSSVTNRVSAAVFLEITCLSMYLLLH